MMMIFWVSPDIDTWRVQREGAHRPERICGTREEAIDWACRAASDLAPAQVRVQDYGGSVTAQFDFDRRVVHAAQ